MPVKNLETSTRPLNNLETSWPVNNLSSSGSENTYQDPRTANSLGSFRHLQSAKAFNNLDTYVPVNNLEKSKASFVNLEPAVKKNVEPAGKNIEDDKSDTNYDYPATKNSCFGRPAPLQGLDNPLYIVNRWNKKICQEEGW